MTFSRKVVCAMPMFGFAVIVACKPASKDPNFANGSNRKPDTVSIFEDEAASSSNNKNSDAPLTTEEQENIRIEIQKEAKDVRSTCKPVGPGNKSSGPLLRPLSNSQYALTAKTLLGVNVIPELNLPADSHASSFDTNAEGMKLTPTLAEIYYNASLKLANLYVTGKGKACASQSFDSKCTGPALAQFAAQAFRRPLSAEERARWSALPAKLVGEGHTPEAAFMQAVSGVLMAPHFLFRANSDEDSKSPVDAQLILAANLSYLLWNNMPDAALLNLATQGKLKDTVLIAEIERLLNDPKAEDFIANFSSQWLGIADLKTAPPASSLSPQLVADMATETIGFVNHFLVNNVNVKSLLDARFTFLTPALAAHYGISAQASSMQSMAKVEVSGAQRGGLMSQAAFLVATSNPTETSPVKRGKWVLDNLLCAPPEAPPNNEAGMFQMSDANLPIRQRLAKHRITPSCASCHDLMDPLGLGLENFDAKGQWRDKDSFGPIDPSGVLPPKDAFNSPQQLAQLIKKNPAFPLCFVSKLSTYALGREPTADEKCIVQKISERSATETYGLKDTIRDITLTLLMP